MYFFPTTHAQGKHGKHSGTTDEGADVNESHKERGYIDAGDRLRALRRNLDALSRRWQAGDTSVTAEANTLQAEVRMAEASYHRAKALAVRAVSSARKRYAPPRQRSRMRA